MTGTRAHWGSRIGFTLAAAGSAVGLGNIWRFPYVTGENGGGLFVIVYLVFVAVIGLPIMLAEVFVGRGSQKSPVGAYRAYSGSGSPWLGFGWLCVIAAFVGLSFYSVVAGWSLHYAWLSLTRGFVGRESEEIAGLFPAMIESPTTGLFCHVLFMVLTMVIVIGGVKEGIERWSRILLPTLFVMLLVLLVYGMLQDGFGRGFGFVFGLHAEQFTAQSILVALGQAFFSLSVGMGALITYGSYLRREDDMVGTTVSIGVIDTGVALLAALVIFPVLFAAGVEPDQGPGVAFVSLPIAFSGIPGGGWLAPAFFLLFSFAALTSTISLLEVATAYFIDERGWSRPKATLITGGAITLLGIPAALSFSTALFGARMEAATEVVFGAGNGKSWLDLMDYLFSNWMLPIGGLGVSLLVAWRVGDVAREEGFRAGTRLGVLYWGWVLFLRYVVPVAVLAIFLSAVGVFGWLGIGG